MNVTYMYLFWKFISDWAETRTETTLQFQNSVSLMETIDVYPSRFHMYNKILIEVITVQLQENS
jgi:hypothetical protein